MIRAWALASALMLAPGGVMAQATQSTPFTLTTGSPRTPEQLAVRFDSADLAFRLDPIAKSLAGDATLTFTALQPLTRLAVELDTRFALQRIEMDGEALSADRWRNPEGRLTLELGRTLEPGQSVRVRIVYAGKPHEAKNAPWDGGFVWKTAPSGESWIATAVQGQGCDLFWPCIDHPQGEPARVDLAITAPAGLVAPGNGRFVGKTDNPDGTTTWRWTARDATTYGITLNLGPFTEKTGVYQSRFGNTVPLSFWHLKTDDPNKVAALFAEFPKMLEFFEATIGPFPFSDEKMGVVETPHLGMEHQTLNAYGNGYKLDHRPYDWLLQHELAHEWFGNQLTNADWDDMWLHEGLGTYMQPLYARWLHGEQAMQSELWKMQFDLINRRPIVSGRSQTSNAVYGDATGPGLDLYYKGALVMHSLRLMVGDEAFFDIVRRTVYGRPDPRPGNFRPRYATTRDFIATTREVTGRDLQWFFDVYLYRAALPELKADREGTRMTLEWLTGDAPFPMPVEVEVQGRVHTIAMTGGRGFLTVPTEAPVLIDPGNKLLRKLDHVTRYRAAQGSRSG